MSPLRFVLMLPGGDAQLVTSDDVAYAGAAKLPGGVIALSLTLRPDVIGGIPAGHAFTLRTDAQTALEIMGGYLGAPAVEAPPKRRGQARAAPRGAVLPLFPPVERAPVAVEPVEAPAPVEAVEAPQGEPVEAPPVDPGEARVGVLLPRGYDASKAHTGNSKSGGYHPSDREPKPRERNTGEVETTPLSPAELADLPRPLLRHQAAADLVNLGEGHGLSTRKLGARWGWSNSTVALFIRRVVVTVGEPGEVVSPAYRQDTASETPVKRQRIGHTNRLGGTIPPAYRQDTASVSPAFRQLTDAEPSQVEAGPSSGVDSPAAHQPLTSASPAAHQRIGHTNKPEADLSPAPHQPLTSASPAPHQLTDAAPGEVEGLSVEAVSPADRQLLASYSPATRPENGHTNRLGADSSPATRQLLASHSPATRQPPTLAELLKQVDDCPIRPAPQGLVARFIRRCAEEGVHDGGAAALAKRWGWEVHAVIRLRASIQRTVGKKLTAKLASA